MALPPAQREEALRLGAFDTLTEAQLMECVSAAQILAPTMTTKRYGLYFGLDIEAKVQARHIMHLTDLLQSKGINRFNLQTRYQ